MLGMLSAVPALLRRADIGRWLPWIAAALVAGLVWWQFRAAIDAAEQRGAAAQRLETARAAAALRASQEAEVAAADRSAASAIHSRQSQEIRYVERIRTLYRDRPDPVCIDADGMRVIAEADRAVGASGTADHGPDPVRETAAR
jgi:hypothetical protein